jgi:hypothetical protein
MGSANAAFSPVTGTLTSGAFPSTSLSAASNFSLASTVGTGGGFPGLNPLPVQLTRFAANAKTSGIALDWATASEKNSAYFEVQRSGNGELFETIATVQAQGNSSSTRTYASLDRTPLAGLAYYRLRQVDTDGKVSLSPVVTATWNGITKVELYPNPSNGTVYVKGIAGSVEYRVLNNQGQALLKGATTGNTGVDVKALPAGSYLLEIIGDGGRSVQRFVRQ